MTVIVALPAGTQTLAVDQDNGGWNLHAMTFAPSGVAWSWFEVVNQSSGLCATVAGGSTANGTAVEQLAHPVPGVQPGAVRAVQTSGADFKSLKY